MCYPPIKHVVELSINHVFRICTKKEGLCFPKYTNRRTESNTYFLGILLHPIILTISSWQGDLPGAVQVAGVVARETWTKDDTTHLRQHPAAASWQHRHSKHIVKTGNAWAMYNRKHHFVRFALTERRLHHSKKAKSGTKQLQAATRRGLTIF